MRQLMLLTFMFFSMVSYASEEDWGQTGHRVTGEIAQSHLSKKAQRKINKILKGQSLAFVSTYGDDIKSDSRYKKYGPWHYVNLEPGKVEYKKEEANPSGDLVFAINKCIAALEDKNTSMEDQEFYLKMLVHFIGDLHQPFHTGRGADKGGNDIQVRWFNQGTNIHRVWDSQMIDGFQMSYTELAGNAEKLTGKEIEAISSGSVLDWMYESKELSEKVYASVEIGDKLGYGYAYEWFPVVREQLQKGGIRLAELLNAIYG